VAAASWPASRSDAGLLRRLARFGDPGGLPVAIERPDGCLVDLLLEAGHPVVPVKPNAIKTWREGEVLPGAKSDAGDAAVIAGYLRLRAHRLRAAAPYSDETRAPRTVVRTRGDLAGIRVAATNQLSALLDAHWPGARAVFADVESPVSLEFLSRYPTPAAAAHPGEKRMAAFCVKHGYSGRRTAAQLLARLRAAPAGTGLEALTEALRDAVLAAVAVLMALTASVKSLDQAVPRRGHHLRRQQPPRQPPGREDLRRRPGGRQGPPPRRPDTGPRLDPGHLALLARRSPLRPRPARRRPGAPRHPASRLNAPAA